MGDEAAQLTGTARALSAARMAIGLSALLAPRQTGRLFGFPQRDINASSILVSRYFAIRELAIGAVTLAAIARDPLDARIYALNAVVDGGDGLVCAATAVTDRRVTRAQVGSVLVAGPIAATWVRLALGVRSARSAAVAAAAG